MKQLFTHLKGLLPLLLFCAVFNPQTSNAQAVTEIITDYQGFWKSGVGAINPIKPENSHNLVSFTYNGVRYSTGVNDALLTTQGQTFSAQEFVALPMQFYSGNPTSDTYIGVGQLYDGVNNGTNVANVVNNIPLYLTDGPQGLDIGTCVANIPSGNISFGISNMDVLTIGDGVPDILITQIAQPSSAMDQYTFRDANGNVVGNAVNIVLTNIAPVGNWMADFYRVITNPMIVPPGFVNTERPFRLWAADLSDFGITPANYDQIQSFTINLKGTSDLAFIAYNFAAAQVTPLPSGLALQKEGTYQDTNGNCIVDAGDKINYTFKVINTGEAALINVMVSDPLITVNGAPISLAAGASNATQFTGSYTLTPADVAAGAVYNLATVTANNAQTNAVLTATSLDPTPIGSNHPKYNPNCPDCTVTVLPIQNITAPANVTLGATCGTGGITGLVFSTTPVTITPAQFIAAGGSIAFPALITSVTYQDVASGTCPIVVTRTFTFSSGPNCAPITKQQLINLEDGVAPTATAPAPFTVQGCNLPFPAPDTSVVTNVADNCSQATVTFVSDSTPALSGCTETITRTYNVTDACGNVLAVTQTLTRTLDLILPTATAPADIVILEFNQAIPAADVTLVTDEADNCGVPTVTFAGDSAPVLNGCTETIVRTYNVTDSCGNILALHQNIIRSVDTTSPAQPSLENIVSPCEITVTAPTTTDNCAGTVTGTTTDPLTYTTPGTYTINWTFNDGNGNATTAQQTVIIDANATPSAPVLPVINEQCSAVVTAPTVVDQCTDSVITGTTTDPLAYTTQGTFIINWSFDYGNNLVLTSQQTVNINDTENPVILSLTTVEADCTVTVQAPTTTDNCAGTITGTTTDPLTYNVPGTYSITWSFNDGNGNIVPATQTIIVHALIPSIPTTLADATGECSATATAPTVTDPCSGGTITATTSDLTTRSEQGTFPVTWTFTFADGSQGTVSQNIVVNDISNPDVPTLANLVEPCAVTVPVAQTTDNCGGTIAGTTTDPLFYDQPGTYTINWTFTDANGNSSTAQQTVTINSTSLPTIPDLSNIEEQCSATAVAPSFIDTCTGLTVTATTTDATTFSTQGTFNIQWTYTFQNGTVTKNQTVIIDDTIAPVANLQPITLNCGDTLPLAVATDNCAGQVNGTLVSPVPTAAGTYTIDWTFDDGNGNSTPAQQQVTINDAAAQTANGYGGCNTDTSALVDLSTLLPAGTPANGTWTDLDNTGGLQGSSFAAFGVANGTYDLQYVVPNGDCSITVALALSVDDLCNPLPCGALVVHNALTPNGDTDNDTMIIDNITDPCYVSNSIEIFNRWGVMVYDAKDYNNTTVVFKGISEGRATLKKNEELPAGTYFYVLKAVGEDGAVTEKASYLYISR